MARAATLARGATFASGTAFARGATCITLSALSRRAAFSGYSAACTLAGKSAVRLALAGAAPVNLTAADSRVGTAR